MKSILGLLMIAMLTGIAIKGSTSTSISLEPLACSPEMLQETNNPKIHEICKFLTNYAAAVQQQFNKGSPLYPLGLIDNGVKRQDMDHVFLRFGRRRRR